MKEEMDGEVFISRQSWKFSLHSMNKVLFPFCTLIWHVNNYVSRQGKVYKKETELLFLLYKL